MARGRLCLPISFGLLGLARAADTAGTVAAGTTGVTSALTSALSTVAAGASPTPAAAASTSTVCSTSMGSCQTAYTTEAAGRSAATECTDFTTYQTCFNTARTSCPAAEFATWKIEYDKILEKLPKRCIISTTVVDLLGSADPSGTSFEVPDSGMRSGGRASGSSGVYAMLWQWLLLLCICCCCFCCTGGFLVMMAKRPKKGQQGVGAPAAYPMAGGSFYDPQAMPLNSAYTANMPTMVMNPGGGYY